ncbi:MAG: glycosyltransferase family 2 protein [Saccharofermentans sp.]|nr:glycosyltransferase family 2 protein [Saccharofermentans sp.]
MDKIAVLIPCYNEEKTIAKVVSDFRNALPDAKIYVYNNNSTDNSVTLAKEAGAIVRNVYKQGKGNVIRRMFSDIDAECYVMADADDTYPAESAPGMVEAVLKDNYDMVIGDRLSSTYYSENKRPFHNVGNRMVCRTINRFFGSDLTDIMTGFRAFSFEFVKTFPVLSGGFEIETEMSIHAIDKNLAIKSIPIDYRDRKDGSESKLNTFSDGIKVLGTIRRLFERYRPLRYFGGIALVLMVLAIAFFIPVLIDYLNTGLVLRFPTLIVCGFVGVAAVQSFFSGLILNNIYHKNRQEFELHYSNKSLEKRRLKSE